MVKDALMQRIFITATGTGVGKTLVTTSLCHQLHTGGIEVNAIKPVISGFDWNDEKSDTHQILASLGRDISQSAIDEVSPFRFKAALSPNMAAELEGTEINFEAVVTHCLEKGNEKVRLIEGAGGLMTPINHKKTFLDLATRLEAEIILVAGSYLGSISHTLTALQALESKGLKAHGIVISESEDGAVDINKTCQTITDFSGIKPFALPRFNINYPKWKHNQPMLGIIGYDR